MPWPSVRLGDVCDFRYGKSLPASQRQRGGIRVYGSNGPVGTHDVSITSGSTIVIGRKGSVGEVHFSAEGCWPIDTTYYVDATTTSVDLQWLYYRLRDLGLTRMNKAAAVPGLNRDDAYRLALLLPPIEEQRRIADILDRADALRAKRREALAHLDDLTRSIFLDMFDEPNQKWQTTEVGDLVNPDAGGIRTGPFGSQLLHSEFVDDGIAVLGIDNAVTNRFTWSGRRYITRHKYDQLVRYTVHPGDVLITIMGTCGRAAIVPDHVPVAINTKHLCCISLDRSRCLPEFLHSCFLIHPAARRYLNSTAKGAIMSGLNMGIIKTMPIIVPPLTLQAEFVKRLRAAESSNQTCRAQLAELDTLFAALQQRAFAGEL
ncbi:MAG: restriction endonuclease subunit S [Actinomycetota bacterium]|nr:restriction endonuclease subunit S [Actinomycetota bacterium]